MPMLVISAEQCLGARAMLRLTRDDLAKAAEVAVATLADFEVGRRQPHPRTIAAIRAALEAGGIEFTNGEAPGVRLVSSSSVAGG